MYGEILAEKLKMKKNVWRARRMSQKTAILGTLSSSPCNFCDFKKKKSLLCHIYPYMLKLGYSTN